MRMFAPVTPKCKDRKGEGEKINSKRVVAGKKIVDITVYAKHTHSNVQSFFFFQKAKCNVALSNSGEV